MEQETIRIILSFIKNNKELIIYYKKLLKNKDYNEHLRLTFRHSIELSRESINVYNNFLKRYL